MMNEHECKILRSTCVSSSQMTKGWALDYFEFARKNFFLERFWNREWRCEDIFSSISQQLLKGSWIHFGLYLPWQIHRGSKISLANSPKTDTVQEVCFSVTIFLKFEVLRSLSITFPRVYLNSYSLLIQWVLQFSVLLDNICFFSLQKMGGENVQRCNIHEEKDANHATVLHSRCNTSKYQKREINFDGDFET